MTVGTFVSIAGTLAALIVAVLPIVPAGPAHEALIAASTFLAGLGLREPGSKKAAVEVAREVKSENQG
jgi:hypothetical protein